jgi:hypothetical protein
MADIIKDELSMKTMNNTRGIQQNKSESVKRKRETISFDKIGHIDKRLRPSFKHDIISQLSKIKSDVRSIMRQAQSVENQIELLISNMASG